MLFEGSLQDCLAAAALRRQPLLIAVIGSDEQLTVVTEASIEGAALVHVVKEGTEAHSQVDALSTDKNIPRVHVFAPQTRGLPPTVLSKESLTSAMVTKAVAIAGEWTQKEMGATVSWAMNAMDRAVRTRDEMLRKRAAMKKPSAPTATATPAAKSAPVPAKQEVKIEEKTPPVEQPRPTSAGIPLMVVELPDGTKLKMQLHLKTTLSQLRKRLVAEKRVQVEFFHFIICDGGKCRKVAHKDESESTLAELGVHQEAVIQVNSDSYSPNRASVPSPAPAATATSPTGSASPTSASSATKKKVVFVHPVTQENEEMEVAENDDLQRIWDRLKEPSGDWMFLPSKKKKLTKSDAKGMTGGDLFAENKVLLLNAPTTGSPTEKKSAPEATAAPEGTTGVSANTPASGAGDSELPLKIVFPSGESEVHRFSSSSPLQSVKDIVIEKEGPHAEKCVLQLAFPPRRFTDADLPSPLGALKVSPNSVIRVSIPQDIMGGGSGGAGAPNFFSKMAAWIPGMGGGARSNDAQPPPPQAQTRPQRGGVATLRRSESASDDDAEGGDEPGNRYYGGTSTETQGPKKKDNGEEQ